MQFSDLLIPKVLDRSKTVTRRPAKYNRSGKLLPCTYKPNGGPGGTYALQGPPEEGSKARARTIPGYRLRVVSVSEEPSTAWDLSDAEARKEGFENRDEFRLYWVKLYGNGSAKIDAWRIGFELVEVDP